MTRDVPLVSLGLPVFNGADFLETALASIREQTFENFELVICDNASTDSTADICRRAAQLDSRIRFERNEKNLGAAYNYNRTFELAQGEYFKWCAHDDLLSPDFLERCVEVLNACPDAALAYAQWQYIDHHGNMLPTLDFEKLEIDGATPGQRFSRMITRMGRCTPVFGLMRSTHLAQTRKIGAFPHADRITLLELALVGEFHLAATARFYLRMHPGTSLQANKNARDIHLWYDSGFRKRPTDPLIGLIVEKLRAVRRIELSPLDRLRCLLRIGLFTVTAGNSRLVGWCRRRFQQGLPKGQNPVTQPRQGSAGS